jgi:hypothetical protein
MTEAIFGLLGVLVGGILTGVVESVREHLRERAELRAARRLLHLELLAAEWVLSTALESDDTSRLKGAITVARWSEFSGLLAKNVDPSLWRTLAQAYGPLSSLRVDSEFMESRRFLPAEREANDAYLAYVRAAEGALRNEAVF